MTLTDLIDCAKLRSGDEIAAISAIREKYPNALKMPLAELAALAPEPAAPEAKKRRKGKRR